MSWALNWTRGLSGIKTYCLCEFWIKCVWQKGQNPFCGKRCKYEFDILVWKETPTFTWHINWCWHLHTPVPANLLWQPSLILPLSTAITVQDTPLITTIHSWMTSSCTYLNKSTWRWPSLLSNIDYNGPFLGIREISPGVHTVAWMMYEKHQTVHLLSLGNPIH